LEEKPITLYSGSVKPLRVLHHRWRVQRVLKAARERFLDEHRHIAAVVEILPERSRV
jgi:predicted PP-loop superfamily ATPase